MNLLKFLRVVVIKILKYYNHDRRYPNNINAWLEKTYFFSKYKYWPNFHKPSKLSEYICYIKLYGDYKKMAFVADKYKIREEVKKRAGEEYLLEIYDTVKTPDDISEYKYMSYPDLFVAKPNHASGRVFINKKKDFPFFYKQVQFFMREYGNVKNELHYKHIEPRLLIEEYISPLYEGLYDLKFYVFKGKVLFVIAGKDIWNAKTDKNRTYERIVYDRNWNITWYQISAKQAEEMERPSKLKEMIDIAEALAKDWEFMRVDLYWYDNKIKFSEMTPTPASGRKAFIPFYAEKYLYEKYLKV